MRSFGKWCLMWVLLVPVVAFAGLHFPELNGRVVDVAHVLKPDTIRTLETTLADYENGTSNQVVVVTLPSLEGTSIEDYGYQLGRHWQIGQKGKDNGVLLIIAPNEHKVRIEVGYGLEPILTDAAASEIVQGIILPAFRADNLQQGVVDGVQAIISVLGGKGIPSYGQGQQLSPVAVLLFFVMLFWVLSASRRHPLLAAWLLSNMSSRYGSSRYDGGGGFSGGGGSFGGGGSSGSW